MNTHRNILDTKDLHQKMSTELSGRYNIDTRLASEMAWDILEVIVAVDGDLDTLDKYILN